MLGSESPPRAGLFVFTHYNRHFYSMQLGAPCNYCQVTMPDRKLYFWRAGLVSCYSSARLKLPVPSNLV